MSGTLKISIVSGVVVMSDSAESFREARDAVESVLDHVLDEEGINSFCEYQQTYFRLQFEVLARTTELTYNQQSCVKGLDGVSVSKGYSKDDPQVRFMDNMSVHDPENPFTTHHVSMDHCVDESGEVWLEINAVPVEEVGQRAGSHIQ